ncbi:class I SAM-dependent methyltransferase [Caulobacter sp. ErkDOM-YI]|uniref:class I SAM-dependent methyltransferase n=1 Tax=unclassified Caulobacter TaxID=2648921 RepID=UPI003AF9CD5B
MPDLLFADAELAALYDAMNPGRDDYDFYRPMVMAAHAVLDVGCGTGSMLHQARDAGHGGRLCGLDPALGMLAQARRRDDVEWVLGDLSSVAWDAEFDLAVMTGHAFQVLVEDDELRDALARIHAALKPGGRFAFETRNPSARAWEAWESEVRSAFAGPHGESVQVSRKVTTPFNGRVVSFSHTFQSVAWDQSRVSHSTLRFIGKADLDAELARAGLMLEAQFGDWDESPLTETSPEIITIARRT